MFTLLAASLLCAITIVPRTRSVPAVLQANVVDVPIFSFFMGNIDTDSPDGVLTLGGVNQTHYEGNVTLTPFQCCCDCC